MFGISILLEEERKRSSNNMCVYDGIDKNTALDIINSLANIEGAEKGITVSQDFLKALVSALNEDEQEDKKG
jgi:hypothetical protein